MPFKQINPTSVSEQVIHQIIEVIQSDNYDVGDRLPSERKLADMMGISRPTLREALMSLAILGILEIKQGAGTFVRANGVDEKLAFKAAELLATEKSPMQALEARILLEPSIAALAAERANKETLRIMKSSLEKIKHRVEEGRLFKSVGQSFFLAMIRSVGNPVVEHVAITPLAMWYSDVPGWQEIVEKTVKESNRLKRNYASMKKIYVSIESQNPKKAKEATKNFLSELQEDFLSA